MLTRHLGACAVLASLLIVPPAGATAPATSAPDTWRGWTALLDTDPYAVPEAAGRLRGIAPATRCGAATTDLGTAVERLSAALGVADAVAPGIALEPARAAYLARLTDCLATHAAHLPAYDGERLGMAGESLRAAWLGATADLARLAAQAPAVTGGAFTPTCVDTGCLIQTGGTGDDVYTANAVLVVDDGGNDTYRNNAAGADPLYLRIPAALFLDRGTGADRYEPVNTDLYGAPSNGSGGTGGVGVLVDEGGDDHYCGLGGTMGTASTGGAGLLLDLGGADFYESFDPDADSTDCPWNAGTRFGQSHKVSHGGAAYGGWGLLVDTGGSDHYLNYGVDSLGWGGVGGTGLLLDGGDGDDTYEVRPATTGCGTGFCTPHDHSGVSIGLGEVGGVGVLLDGGGADSYGCYESMTYGCIGASTGGVLGLVYDAGGDDAYTLSTQVWTDRQAGLGAAEDIEVAPPVGNSSGLVPLTGAGVFVDVAGNDSYVSASPRAAGWGSLAVGSFADLAGTDTYAVAGPPPPVRGNGLAWQSGLLGVGVDAP